MKGFRRYINKSGLQRLIFGRCLTPSEHYGPIWQTNPDAHCTKQHVLLHTYEIDSNTIF